MIVFAHYMFESSNIAKTPYAIMHKNCLFSLYKFRHIDGQTVKYVRFNRRNKQNYKS